MVKIVIKIFNVIFMTSAMFASVVHAEKVVAPAGWKIPKKVTNSGCDRSKSDLFSVESDFDGDGKKDFAQLLASKNGKELGVWVTMGQTRKPLLIASTKSVDGRHDMGIGLVKPGKYKTLCGKGYVPCKKESDAELFLENPAIDFFTCESANRFIYWRKEDKKFFEEWMSD